VDGAQRMSDVLLSVLVGALFTKFGLFLNTSLIAVGKVVRPLRGTRNLEIVRICLNSLPTFFFFLVYDNSGLF